MPDSIYAWFDIVSDTCHLAPYYLNSDEPFLTPSDQYCNPEWGFKPGSSSECLLEFVTRSKLLGHHNRFSCGFCKEYTLIQKPWQKKCFVTLAGSWTRPNQGMQKRRTRRRRPPFSSSAASWFASLKQKLFYFIFLPLFFLLSCHLRLSQWLDDTVVGWLNHFCHNTLPAKALQLYTQLRNFTSLLVPVIGATTMMV